ncbi:hypothetical protein O998_03595 [Anaplasma phagocytophilum str. Norway variant1]|uniref:Uncharacterized protein n=1 Tax=Anaplasma phagocytophilum str. Norway variant1 TaxID=1392506 RepID=A0A7H9DZ76_ANAPH|nr:hypothetical protein [Anaplasma phagocytophilum]QLL66858.1 hypothetical protein O998_03595 [Anaplasma phagocytophilum str. Norway variant1]
MHNHGNPLGQPSTQRAQGRRTLTGEPLYSYRSTRRVRHGHKSSEEVFSIVKNRIHKAHCAVKVALEEAEALRNPPSDADAAGLDVASADAAGANAAGAAGLDAASVDVADAAGANAAGAAGLDVAGTDAAGANAAGAASLDAASVDAAGANAAGAAGLDVAGTDAAGANAAGAAGLDAASVDVADAAGANAAGADADAAGANAAGAGADAAGAADLDVAGAGADAAGLDAASADVTGATPDIPEQIDFQLLNEIASKLSDLSRQAYHLENSSLPYDTLFGLSKLSSNPKLLLSPNNLLAGHLNDALSYASNVIEILQLHFGRYKIDDPSRISGKELAMHKTVLRFRRAARTLCNAFDSISDDALQNALKPVMECNIQRLRTIVAQSSAVSLSMSYLVCRETSQENRILLQDCIRQKFEPLVMVAKAVLEAPNCSSEAIMSCSIACAAYEIMRTELNAFASDKPTLDSAVEDADHIYANLLECISCMHLMHSWYRKTANIEGDPTNSDIVRNAMMDVALSLQECVTDLNNNRKRDGRLCNTFTSACLSGITKRVTSARQCLQSLNTDSMINPDESRILVAACRNALQAIESRCERRIRERSIESVGQPEPTGDVATLLTNILTNRSMTFSKAASSTLFPNLQ